MAFQRTESMLPGGLKIKFPLSEMSVPPIFVQVIRADFKPENVENGVDREQVTVIMAALKEKVTTTQQFVARNKICNFLRWAHDKVESEEYTQVVVVEKVEDSRPAVYQFQVTPDFTAHNVIHSSAFLMLDPVTQESWRRVQGKITSFDPVTNRIRFVPLHSNVRIEEQHQYEVRLHPSSFAFRSCDRTLTWLITLNLDDCANPVICSDLVSKKVFGSKEKLTLPTLPFSDKFNFNKQQCAAIFAITSGLHGKTPYILHGPPGTGKTITLIEAVRQLLLNYARKPVRILLCAPSNTAADLLATELLKTGVIPTGEMFRMYSLMRDVASQSQELRELMCIRHDDVGGETFGIYSKEKLLEKKVVISTLCASTYLMSGDLRSCFTHIFVDEAGQAGEVDALVPLVGLADLHARSTKVVLAGDPMQLGPVEKLKHADEHGLGVSLMERYMSCNYFNKADRRLTCTLQESYRSHPAILKIPSALFYGGQMFTAKSVADKKNSLVNFEYLPKLGFPIIFHSVEFAEKKEATGHSFCNPGEFALVVNYVQKLLDSTDIKPNQIGVISPYKYQVRLLQEKLSCYPEMTIDSVERFQGSERRVIIVSTVRSKELGFLCCNKRFNTTIMRAEELLIVIGNEELLSHQPSWRSFLDYCRENEAITAGSGEENSEKEDDESYVSETDVSDGE